MSCHQVRSQISFKEGYFVDNNGNRVDCYISAGTLSGNPNDLSYKMNPKDQIKTLGIDEVQEFGVSGKARFLRFTVDLDMSSASIGNLDDSFAPKFEKRTLFLKVIVEGKASLYSYKQREFTRFFYRTDKVKVEQLIYKKYQYLVTTLNKNADGIGTNMTFRMQLLNNMDCGSKTLRKAENIGYNRQQLAKFFISYNECIGSDYRKF